MSGPKAVTSLPCPTCAALIDLNAIEWCQCLAADLSRRLSVICPACGVCFCNVSRLSTQRQWNRALRGVLEKQATTSPNAVTILIVDDDEEIRLIAEFSLQAMGYRTLSAANAEEALAIVTQTRPDVVLTDALMPKVDGRQLCRLIKLVDRSIKVIVMSSLYRSSRYRIEALHLYRADEYLLKPINFDVLRQLLAKVSRKAA
jgi:CheY-like chemotaxis protein